MALSVDRTLDRLAGWLVPPRCVLCEGPGQRPVLDLCRSCEADLPAPADACPRCALPVAGSPWSGECATCRSVPPPFDRCVAPYAYGFPLDGLVHELKYDGRLAVARVLGTLLGRSVVARGAHRAVDVLVPVPLHADRLVERGFNQSFEIGRWVARETGRSLEPGVLHRPRATRPQVGLPLAARLENLRGAFEADGPCRGRRVAVIDDVMTTGSTVREIARTLRGAGAVRVEVWCVARTPA